jgi:hypothetical protein
MLTLIIIPTLYTLFAASGIKREHKKNKKMDALKQKNASF